MVLVPSLFARRIFEDAGVPNDKLELHRYGFNPSVYSGGVKSNAADPVVFRIRRIVRASEGVAYCAQGLACIKGGGQKPFLDRRFVCSRLLRSAFEPDQTRQRQDRSVHQEFLHLGRVDVLNFALDRRRQRARHLRSSSDVVRVARARPPARS